MLARGIMGNPWLFEEVLGNRDEPPSTAEIIYELEWTMDRAVEHIGEDRAGRYLRKFYPWYVDRLGGGHELQDSLQRAEGVEAAREIIQSVSVAHAV